MHNRLPSSENHAQTPKYGYNYARMIIEIALENKFQFNFHIIDHLQV